MNIPVLKNVIIHQIEEQEVRMGGDITGNSTSCKSISPLNVAIINAFAKKGAVKLSKPIHYTSTSDLDSLNYNLYFILT